MLDIRSCGVLLSCMWYTKQLISCTCSYSDLGERLDSLDPPSVPLWLDMSYDTSFLLVVRLPTKPLLESGISIV
jgi:hypothetical protein